MNLIKHEYKSKKYGSGRIIAQDEKTVTVQFASATVKYKYDVNHTSSQGSLPKKVTLTFLQELSESESKAVINSQTGYSMERVKQIYAELQRKRKEEKQSIRGEKQRNRKEEWQGPSEADMQELRELQDAEMQEYRDLSDAKRLELIEQQETEKRRIYHFLTEERKVKYLVHFTPVDNLCSILKKGILPRTELFSRGIIAKTPDENRLDGEYGYSSFSISFPNYQIFYSKRNDTPYSYVLLLVDPLVIRYTPLNSISYLPTNAASSAINNVRNYTGYDSARSLFCETTPIGEAMISREQLGIPINYTTNPQAEVFIAANIEPAYIKSIVVEDYDSKVKLERSLLQMYSWARKITVDSSLFKYRDDYETWKK